MNTPFSHNQTAEYPAIIEDCSTPPVPNYCRAKLATLKDVSRQLATLYREARSGRIDVADASRLANILAILSRVLTDSELEERLAKLEKQGLH